MRCPYCGSELVRTQVVTETRTKGFGFCKAIIGFIIWWPLFLCGFCGMGRSNTSTHVEYICDNCGSRF